MPQLIMSAAASGTLPDVIGAAPMGQVWQMYTNGLLNTDIPETHRRRTRPGHLQPQRAGADLRRRHQSSACPPTPGSSCWSTARTSSRGRAWRLPDTYAKTLAAAEALTTKGHDGISAATDPSDVFTSQSFESLALANDCQLVDDRHEVALESPAVRGRLPHLRPARPHLRRAGHADRGLHPRHLTSPASPPWSSGPRSCSTNSPACARTPCPAAPVREGPAVPVGQQRHRHRDEGARRPGGGPVRRDHVLGDHQDGRDRGVPEFIEYMMGTGYESLVRHGARGQDPGPQGTAAEPERYLDAWRHSDIGVDTRKPLDEVFPETLLDQLADGVGNLRR